MFNLRFSSQSTRDMNDAIRQLAGKSEKAIRRVIISQARLFCTDLAYNTERKGKTANAAVRHRKDIQGRLDTIYVTAGAAVNMIKRRNQGAAIAFRRAMRKKDFQEASKIMNTYFRSDWRVGMFDGGKLHKEQRFAKRVTKRMVIADKPSLTRYKQETVKKVGFAKGGFAAAARQLGGVRGIPGFATRQNSPGSASVTGSGKSLKIVIRNDVRYIKEALSKAGEKEALSHRKKMITEKLKQKTEAALRRASRSIQ